jgi:hypothetical protein
MMHPCSFSFDTSFLNCLGAGSNRRRSTSRESSWALKKASCRRLASVDANSGAEEDEDEDEE